MLSDSFVSATQTAVELLEASLDAEREAVDELRARLRCAVERQYTVAAQAITSQDAAIAEQVLALECALTDARVEVATVRRTANAEAAATRFLLAAAQANAASLGATLAAERQTPETLQVAATERGRLLCKNTDDR